MFDSASKNDGCFSLKVKSGGKCEECVTVGKSNCEPGQKFWKRVSSHIEVSPQRNEIMKTGLWVFRGWNERTSPNAIIETLAEGGWNDGVCVFMGLVAGVR